MSTVQKLLTEDDLLRRPDDGYCYELIEGELRQMVPTGYEHGRCTGKLHGLLSRQVYPNDLGDLLAAETGFIIDRTADGRVTVRAPDIAFVAKGRIPAKADTSKYLELAPDLVVETLSPADTAVAVEEKIVAWLNAGGRVALTVNPLSRSVTVYRSLTEIVRLPDQAELDLNEVVPGFHCPVSTLFD